MNAIGGIMSTFIKYSCIILFQIQSRELQFNLETDISINIYNVCHICKQRLTLADHISQRYLPHALLYSFYLVEEPLILALHLNICSHHGGLSENY